MKGRDWDYEREVRAIIHDTDNKQKGINKKCADIGVKISGIYVGSNCTDENEKKLIDIAHSFNVFVKRMEPDYAGDWSIMKEKI